MKIKCYLRATGGFMQTNGKVYPAVMEAGKIKGHGLEEQISKNSNLPNGMVKAVLSGLSLEIKKYLALGHSVEVPGLGIFSLDVKGNVKEAGSGEKVIEDGRVVVKFMPNISLRRVLDDSEFEIVSENVHQSKSLTEEEAYEKVAKLLDETGFFVCRDLVEATGVSRVYADKILDRLVAQGKLVVEKLGRQKMYRKPQAAE